MSKNIVQVGPLFRGRTTGFGFCITRAGARAFVLRYRIDNRERRLTIGSYPDWSVIRRDQSGRRTGTIEPGSGDRLILRDDHGRRTGAIERGSNGHYVIRDESGRRTGTAERGGDGNFVLRDAQGRRTGTVERRR
jgi:hypothetical protein